MAPIALVAIKLSTVSICIGITEKKMIKNENKKVKKVNLYLSTN